MKILIIEDEPADYELLKHALFSHSETEFELIWHQSLKEALAYLEDKEVDIVVADLGLPDSQGTSTIDLLSEKVQHIPFVVLTQLDDLRMGILSIKKGAQDFFCKNELKPGIELKLRFALERFRGQHTLSHQKQSLEELIIELKKVIVKNKDSQKLVEDQNKELNFEKNQLKLENIQLSDNLEEFRLTNKDLVRRVTDEVLSKSDLVQSNALLTREIINLKESNAYLMEEIQRNYRTLKKLKDRIGNE